MTFKQDPRVEDAFRAGRSHIGAFTAGGPIVIPKVFDGRSKAFFFANFSKSDDSAPGRLAGNSTVPANRQHLEGDFSDLLLLPSGAGPTTPAGHHQYQIYDPLTTRPDPLRPGRVIRDPFPNNIIPRDRFMNANGTYKNPSDRMALWFDPQAEVSIAAGAEAAYARNPMPQLPPSEFNVQGGVVYAGTPGYDDRTWKPEALWMPRFSFECKLGEKSVVKGGYGVYYDTLNARDFTPNSQEGYDVTTTNPVSTDFGQTWLLGDPRRGILPLVDPFPVRANGSRYQNLVGSSLGADTILAPGGGGYTAENPNRVHSRVQRWRVGWQRDLGRRTVLDIAYAGSYADRQGIAIRQDYLPEQYWSGANVRFFTGDLNSIKKDHPEIALRPDGTFDPTKTWFSIDAGFERDTADQPAGFQKRVFPFRVDGVRGFDLAYVHMNVARTFPLGGRRTFQFRVDIQTLLNRQHYQNPNMDPTSTNFGQIRDVNNSVMRFITFHGKFSF